MAILKNDWSQILESEFEKDYYAQLRNFLKNEYQHHSVYPAAANIFNALHYTSYQQTKVVILGQDPYHGKGQAHGLSFSVQKDIPAPPSLVNIFKELKDDLECPVPSHGCLTSWAKQGVLLLNTVLTVRQGEPASHRGKGWERFTDQVIKALNNSENPIVFMLWGKQASEKASMISNPNHLILYAPHPSPLSAYRGFLGCRHFSKANAYLVSQRIEPIDWRLEVFE
ncbi:uracil-DNA glycosylase [Tindallia californiensis]|uniref:Uracil-DNA glycosylase n=1 Tax=Tindallia californiensis TaxID=159292 RepID=A0A1H3MJT9_9FIRM|nr:uracil-DNA glycosylase [Tindallia californiensis]SDY76856.1 Uracil-DNA glycosylase [Tindallia californiensis]